MMIFVCFFLMSMYNSLMWSSIQPTPVLILKLLDNCYVHLHIEVNVVNIFVLISQKLYAHMLAQYAACTLYLFLGVLTYTVWSLESTYR